MLDWFSEVFSSNSDKARLIAILISALIALSVLLLNQMFNRRKARRDLLIEKIEEIYSCAIQYEARARELLAGINKGNQDPQGNFHIFQEDIDQMNDEVHKLEMLLGLYFPSEKFEQNKFYAGTTLPVLEISVKAKSLSEDEMIEASERTKDNIYNNSKDIKKLCSKLMRTNRH